MRKSVEDNLGAVVIAFLLLFFFEAQLGLEAANTATIMHRILQTRTEELLEPFQIGDQRDSEDGASNNEPE